MANLSTAFGTATITANSVGHLANLLDLHNATNQGLIEFPILLPYSRDEILRLVETTATKHSDDTVSITLEFNGTGRWNIGNNLEEYFGFLTSPTKDSKLNELLREATSVPYKIRWFVKDSEQGLGFIEVYRKTIFWDVEKQRQQSTEPDTLTNLPYTASNLVATGFYTEDDIIDIESALLKFPELLADIKKLKEATIDARERGLYTYILSHPYEFSEYISDKRGNEDVWTDFRDFLFEGLELGEQLELGEEFLAPYK